MRTDRRQPMAIPNVERPERKVQLHRRFVQIAKRRSKHTNPMERNNAGRWSFVLARCCRSGGVRLRHRCCVNGGGGGRTDDATDFGVARKAQHHLVENVFEHEILIVIGGRQLDVLEDELVDNQVGLQDGNSQSVPVLVVLKLGRMISYNSDTLEPQATHVVLQLTAQHARPQGATLRCRCAAPFEDVLTEWCVL